MELKDIWEHAIRGFNEVTKETDTQWGWEKKDTTLYLKFQGSVSTTDWLQNFDYAKTPYRDMPKKFRVHNGFLQKWKSIRKSVQEKITDDVEKIVIIGFSQGGALALLCHEDLWFNFENLRDKLETYALGTPRVFTWGAPRERFESVYYIQYKGDLVTGVPLWIMGYKHVSRNWIKIPKDSKWPLWFRVHPFHHIEYFGHQWEK